MTSAYRESAAVTRVPREEIAWRRRVGMGAGWLPVLLALGGALNEVHRVLSLSVGATIVLGLPIGIGTAISTWMLTTPAPGFRVARLAWVLRVSVIASVPFQPVARYGVALTLAGFVCAIVVDVTGLLYVARLFEAAEQPRRAGRIRVLMVVLVLAIFLCLLPEIQQLALFAIAVGGLWCFFYLWRLRRMSLVTEHQWWLDDAAAAPGTWVSVLLFKDGHAEAISVDGTLGFFVSAKEAYDWMEQNGYVWGQAAVEDGLAAEEPPDILPATA